MIWAFAGGLVVGAVVVLVILWIGMSSVEADLERRQGEGWGG